MEEQNRNLFRRTVRSENATRGKFVTNLGPSSISGMSMHDELQGWNPLEAVMEAYQKEKDEERRRLAGLTGININIDWGKIKKESASNHFAHDDMFVFRLPKFP